MNSGSSIAGRPAWRTMASGSASSVSNTAPNCALTCASEVRGATITASVPS